MRGGKPGRVALVLVSLVSGVMASSAVLAQCEFRSWDHNEVVRQVDRLRHSTGSHRSIARVRFTCTCQTNCRQTCTPTWQGPECVDSGILNGAFRHRPHVKMRLQAGYRNAAITQGAGCGAGYGCFIEECRPGGCAPFPISVSLEPIGVGIGFRFTPSRTPLADLQTDFPFECEPCWTIEDVAGEVRDPYDQIPDPDLDDQPTWSVCVWRCTSYMGADGSYNEDCVLVYCK